MVGDRVSQVELGHAPVRKAIISTAVVSMAHRELDHARVASILLVGLHAVPHLVPLHAVLHDRAVLLAQPLWLHLALANVEARCACVRACVRCVCVCVGTCGCVCVGGWVGVGGGGAGSRRVADEAACGYGGHPLLHAAVHLHRALGAGRKHVHRRQRRVDPEVILARPLLRIVCLLGELQGHALLAVGPHYLLDSANLRGPAFVACHPVLQQKVGHLHQPELGVARLHV
eukprot:scaffold91829_cov60-Phaeocystis_antarctica.AAC.2